MPNWDAEDWNDDWFWTEQDDAAAPGKKKGMIPKLKTGFSRLSESAFKSRATTIVTSLGSSASPNPDFPDPWPAEYPTRAQLASGLADYDQADSDADDGDSGAIAARRAAREVLTERFQRLAPHLEAMAGGDEAKLQSCGYELRKSPTSAGPGPIAAPVNVRLVQGEVSGMLILRGKRKGNPGSFEAQIGTGDPNDPASWGAVKQTTALNRVEFTGLTPGVLYNARVRAIGPNGPGDWSDVAQGRCL